MAGPKKTRPQGERKPENSSGGTSSVSHDPTMRSLPLSIPRLDGNRDPSAVAPVVYMQPGDTKNLSEAFGMRGWYAARGLTIPTSLPQRPERLSTVGKEITVMLNIFNVAKNPDSVVHQYDVAFSGDAKDYTKRLLLNKIWNSRTVKQTLGEPDNQWIYDGNKLAWCGKKLDRDETRITVDLDQEEGRTPPAGARGNKHNIYLRHTRKLDFHGLNAFLAGKKSWNNEDIDNINFLDHLMRQWPSQNYTQVKKSFFQRGEQRYDLGGGIEAFKGVFASLRPVLDNSNNRSLAINVDVANGTFWRAQELTRAVGQVFNCGPPQFITRYRQAKGGDWRNSLLRKDLKKFRHVRVKTMHLQGQQAEWIIDEFSNKDASEHRFTQNGQQITVHQYFRQKYPNVQLQPGLPLVKMTKKIRGEAVYMPMDVLKIETNQRYTPKLSDTQTSQMIKFAVTLPTERWAAIQQGVNLLNWKNDPYLRSYGLKVNPTASRVKARLLPPPSVHFGAGSKEATLKPLDMLNGRWRLDGRKFAQGNTSRPILAWGVGVVQGRGAPPPPAVQKFIANFIRIFESHGGTITAHAQHGKTPYIGPVNLADGGEMIQKLWTQTGNRYNRAPQFLILIVCDRNIDTYRRIKKSCDIRFGVASQVMQAKHVLSDSPQYHSNVCMKVNAKLGGCTSYTKSQVIPKANPKAASIPTMVVGADVSHPAPGSAAAEAASFAAITVSQDIHFTKYWADVQTNGNRLEMITTGNIDNHFGPMAKMWMQRLGQGRPPQRLLYIRDGVSEGQYQAVLEEEVADMKKAFSKLGCKEIPKFTVVIAGKRHHIRFFPDQGDRNKNSLPGTLVETGCTHPFEFDFYLNSHVAIKGTSRPIHYHVILNEGDWSAPEIQSFIFEHSYQYIRSTTPVSLHPAVYYAHLAADRARAHQNDNPVSSGKKESRADKQSSTGSSDREFEVAPLMEINNKTGLKEVMWYI